MSRLQVVFATQGDFGKSRPALVIQSDLFHERSTLTVLPVTGTLVSAPWRYSTVLRNKTLITFALPTNSPLAQTWLEAGAIITKYYL
ncbi:type II toxin-antitoxin system PemK/MazF family toxin [Limnobacter sp. P1]|uniref:type II toxin-antitoxin system PemK/MazF family toxin n=1 Tax=Limnobacter olei TaxID=3031298 RepID=UPI0023B08C66|nr:type II toxin-antitoxin system PemK/MazF family toxin [Limnobacter sp. P1]